MKNTVKTTAAVLTAIMTMSCAAINSSAMYTGNNEEYADGEMHIMSEIVEITGGWEANDGAVAMSKNPAAKAAFKKATEGLVGVNYQPIAVLGIAAPLTIAV